jgi:hypothetical protein
MTWPAEYSNDNSSKIVGGFEYQGTLLEICSYRLITHCQFKCSGRVFRTYLRVYTQWETHIESSQATPFMPLLYYNDITNQFKSSR